MSRRGVTEVPPAHFVDRVRLWRFAAIILGLAVVMTGIEVAARPGDRAEAIATGLFPMVGAPFAWFGGARLTPRVSYGLGRIFMVLGVISSSMSIYSWRGTPVASAMAFHLVLVIVFAAAFFARRDVLQMLVLGAVTSAMAFAADGLQLEDALSWMPMILAVAGTGMMLSSVTATAERLAYRDPLTGSLNRRGWQAMLDHSRDGDLSREHPVSVLLIDLDNFKEINDRLGHEQGDRVLRRAIDAWLEVIRPSDALARLGGDEFAVLLTDCDLDAALAVGERMRAVLREATGATCSIGAATLPPGSDSHEALPLADLQLYAAKAAGRDRVQGTELGSSETAADEVRAALRRDRLTV